MALTKDKKYITHNELMARIDADHKWHGNILQRIAEEVVRYALKPEEWIKTDLTEKLPKEIERQISNNELVKIQINGKVRLGKSTLAIIVALFIHSMLKKYKKKDEKDEFGIKNICRDQTEYAKKMRNPNIMNEALMVDENNKSESTGENATVEQAQKETLSDVQAGRYIHTVYVCPDGSMDQNTDIKIEVRNREKGLIHTRVSYYLKSNLYYGWVPIGTADFDVSELIKQWLLVEPRFMRYLKEKRDEDRKYVEYWAKRDFYVEYMIKKYEKMELMNREGIMHSRDLDYAKIRYTIVEQLKTLASLTFISLPRLKDNVRNKIESEFRKDKLPLSIIGKESETNRIMSFLGSYRSLSETIGNINSMKDKFQKGKINEDDYNRTMTILQTAKTELISEIKQQEETLERLVKLNEKYNQIKD